MRDRGAAALVAEQEDALRLPERAYKIGDGLHGGEDAPAALFGGFDSDFLPADNLFLSGLRIGAGDAARGAHWYDVRDAKLDGFLDNTVEFIAFWQGLIQCDGNRWFAGAEVDALHGDGDCIAADGGDGAVIIGALPVAQDEWFADLYAQGAHQMPAVFAGEHRLRLRRR